MPIYRYNDGGVWQEMANVYRLNDGDVWQFMDKVYRYNDGGVWQIIYQRNLLIPTITVAPTLTNQDGNDFDFKNGDTITLTRGTWTRTSSTYNPVTYTIKIQQSTDGSSWTDVVSSTSATTVSYTLTLADVRSPSYYYRGRVVVENSAGQSIPYITTPVLSHINLSVDTPTVSVTSSQLQVFWTTTPTNNSSNIASQLVEIRTNEAYTYNGQTYGQYDVVYSTTVAPGTSSLTINLSSTNIRPLGSFYALVEVTANDTDGTLWSEISADFNTLAQAYSFSMGNILYPDTNGRIGLDGGSSGTSIPSLGRYLAIFPDDLAYSDIRAWSNSNTYVIRFDGYYYNQIGVASYRLTWMAKFYTNQSYVDVKIITRGTSLSGAKTVGIYSNGTLISGVAGPYSLSTGTTFRVYYSQSTSSVTGITFDEIESSVMVPIGAPTTGGTDDGYWSISTSANYYNPSVYSSVSLTARSDTSLTFSVAASNGFYKTNYVVRTGSYSGSIWTSGSYTSSTSLQITGLLANTTYYITLTPVNVREQLGTAYQLSEYTSQALTPPTNITASVSRYTDSSVSVTLTHSGGSGPYYQMYWTTSSTTPVTTSYDAASTSSNSITDVFSPTANSTYYFYMRSSSENLGTTFTGSVATEGTYSVYSTAANTPSYTFTNPTGGTASISGSTTVGSTLTLTTSAPSASPAATGVTIVWRRADGGAGGNSFTGGSIMQNGGTTYVIDSPLVAYSSVGYAIRAEVTFNNGVGAQTANSNSIVVTQAAPGAFTYSISDSTLTPGTPNAYSNTFSGGNINYDWNDTTNTTYWQSTVSGGPEGTRSNIRYSSIDFWSVTGGNSYTTSVYSANDTKQATISWTASSGAGSYYAVWVNNGVVGSQTTTGTSITVTTSGTVTISSVRAYANSDGTGSNTLGTLSGSSSVTPSTKYSSTRQAGPDTAPTVQYTVTWNANGGSVSPTSSTVTSGSSVTAPTPTRSGYSFNGWYNASSGGSFIVGGGSSYTVTSNITLYAQWTSTFTPPNSTAPALQFQRVSASSYLRWYCDYTTTLSGDYSYIIGMNWQLSTTASTTGLLNSGTRAYPGAGSYPYNAGGTVWAFKAGVDGQVSDITYSSSARYGRARVALMGTDGNTYYGSWSSWI